MVETKKDDKKIERWIMEKCVRIKTEKKLKCRERNDIIIRGGIRDESKEENYKNKFDCDFSDIYVFTTYNITG